MYVCDREWMRKMSSDGKSVEWVHASDGDSEESSAVDEVMDDVAIVEVNNARARVMFACVCVCVCVCEVKCAVFLANHSNNISNSSSNSSNNSSNNSNNDDSNSNSSSRSGGCVDAG